MLKTLFQGKGNYTKEESGISIKYTYFGNTICVVDKINKTFKLDACGYNSYRSTTRALNDLEKYYINKGYKLTERN